MGQPERYPDYDIGNPDWAKIEEGNKLLVHISNGSYAEIPSGQWYAMQELKVLVEWGRENGMSFKFHNQDSVASLVLDQGYDMTLIRDPRPDSKLTSGAQTRVPEGFVLGGLSKEQGEWKPGGLDR